MARKSTRRDLGSTRYEPSRDEQEKSARLLASLTPSALAYTEYRQRVDGYLSMVGPILRGLNHQELKGVRLRRSVLFDGLEYLVAYVDDDWLRRIAPECDAISSAMAGQGGEQGPWFQLPPFVFLPVSKRRTRSEEFRSVIEHEFVHINQVIQGTFPKLPVGREANDLFEQLLGHTAAEYEACFVQTVRWPTAHHVQFDLSLEHWCLVRAYGQALEHVLFSMVDLDFEPREVERFLDALSSSLGESLQRIGASEELASWFPPRLDDHMLVAMQQVLSPSPSVKEHPAFRAAGRWLRDRLGIPPRRQTDHPAGK
jgi:hypothetical protein